ncbi:MAG: hypothetical protein R2861_12435 [Desulfobacterales bacterium]
MILSRAHKELTELAPTNQIPVTSTLMGLAVFPAPSLYGWGCPVCTAPTGLTWPFRNAIS